MAFRITCDLAEILEIVEKIKLIAKTYNGTFYVRGATEEEQYGFYSSATGQYKDITQYVYLCLPNLGVVEIQVGELLANETFKRDSAIRSGANSVDLWNDNFYDSVKDYRLDLANGKPPATSVEELERKAQHLFRENNGKDEHTVPENISGYLNSLRVVAGKV